jgi:hypothetical protein
VGLTGAVGSLKFPPRLRWARRAAPLACCTFLLSAAAVGAGDAGRIRWKPIVGAQLKLDGRTPLQWNVYQLEKPDKKKRVVLIQLGRRYLALDLRGKRVYSVLPSDLKAEGAGFESDDLVNEARLIPTSDWLIRDVGPAELVKVTLGDYGRVLELQLPHPPDLRAFY